MKTISRFLLAVVCSLAFNLALAQAPTQFNYQAVLRNAEGTPIANQATSVKVELLQGSTTGTVVFTETHNVTTSTQGLINMQIGSIEEGIGDIDWGVSTYFVRISVNDIEFGTSQLLSVPYAMHAKTADTVINSINETDPVFTAWDKNYNDLINTPTIPIVPANVSAFTNDLGYLINETDPIFVASVSSGITETDITNWNNKQDELTAGTGIIIAGNVISSTSSSTYYSIGDFAHGGIVFWVDETGQHGLVCAKTDQIAGFPWTPQNKTNTLARGNGIKAGIMNTTICIATQGYGTGTKYSARICNELEITENEITYGDWYLPSKYELFLMYQRRVLINLTAIANGGTSLSGIYWSSTEKDIDYAHGISLSNGTEYFLDKSATNYNIRAVRAF